MTIHRFAGAALVVGALLHLTWTAGAANDHTTQGRQQAPPQPDPFVSQEVLGGLSGVDAKLVQDEKDMLSASTRVSVSCEASSDAQDLISQVREADQEIQSVEGLLTMYSYMHSATDRESARGYLRFIVNGSRSLLDNDVKGIGFDLASPSIPPGAAAIGVRDRDEIRKAIAVLTNLSPK